MLAYPLLRTSRLVRDGKAIMMQRSNAFFLVVIVLAVDSHRRPHLFRPLSRRRPRPAAIFFVLAFGMILHWRLRMYFEYRQLAGELVPANGQ